MRFNPSPESMNYYRPERGPESMIDFSTLRGKAQLTSREKETLSYMAAGFTSEEIGQKLYIGTATVNSHRKTIIGKLGVPNVTAAVAHAIRHKLIT
jgi:DNA-binding CsgD family transcriptional regulator